MEDSGTRRERSKRGAVCAAAFAIHPPPEYDNIGLFLFAYRAADGILMFVRLGTAGRSGDEVVAEILDEDDCLADFARNDDGRFVITEHNCAVLAVATRYRHACAYVVRESAPAPATPDLEPHPAPRP